MLVSHIDNSNKIYELQRDSYIKDKTIEVLIYEIMKLKGMQVKYDYR